MKIGLVYYTQTGNTLSVMEKIAGELKQAGHEAAMHKLVPIGEVHPGIKDVKFESLPDIGSCDGLIFGSPVHAFSLCPAMTSYLSRLGPIGNKKAAIFVTQHFPFAWMGGNRAISTMQKLLEEKGATVMKAGVVNWSNRMRPLQINDVVARAVEAFVG